MPIYKSAIRPCIEYDCHILSVDLAKYLDILDKIQWRVCYSIYLDLASRFKSLSQRCDVASKWIFPKSRSSLSSEVHRPHEFKRTTRFTTSSHHFTADLYVSVNSMLIIFFLTLLCRTLLLLGREGNKFTLNNDMKLVIKTQHST